MYNIKDNKGVKSNIVYTPENVVSRIWTIIEDSGLPINHIIDPCIGSGALVRNLHYYSCCGCTVTGVDPNDCGLDLDQFIHSKFEDTTDTDYDYNPDLVICNPPFAGYGHGKLFPEVILRKIFELFGEVPIVLITGMNLRLNCRMYSKRNKWMRDYITISSILTLPMDIFKHQDGKVIDFHTEVLFINFPDGSLKGHYYL